MSQTLDDLLDMIEPVLDHERPDFLAAVAHTAGLLRGSSLVAKPGANDRDLVIAGILAYGSLAVSRGYEADGLQEEMEGPLVALLGQGRADTLLAEWRGSLR